MTWAFIKVSYALKLPAGLLMAVCTVESNQQNVINFNDGVAGHKPSASIGYCQVKPATGKMVGCSSSDLMNPEKNIECAGKYLALKLEKHKSVDKAVCAYNGVKNPTGKCGYYKKVRKTWTKQTTKRYANMRG